MPKPYREFFLRICNVLKIHLLILKFFAPKVVKFFYKNLYFKKKS